MYHIIVPYITSLWADMHTINRGWTNQELADNCNMKFALSPPNEYICNGSICWMTELRWYWMKISETEVFVEWQNFVGIQSSRCLCEVQRCQNKPTCCNGQEMSSKVPKWVLAKGGPLAQYQFLNLKLKAPCDPAVLCLYHYAVKYLRVRSCEVSKPRDWVYSGPYRSQEIWHASRHQCHRNACQILQRPNYSQPIPHGFETSRDLGVRRLTNSLA